MIDLSSVTDPAVRRVCEAACRIANFEVEMREARGRLSLMPTEDPKVMIVDYERALAAYEIAKAP